MHSALVLLLRLRRRAWLRRMLSGLKTVRGALLLLVTIGFLGCILLPNLVMPLLATLSPQGARMNQEFVETSVRRIRTFAPLVLLGMATLSIATSWGEAAIYFTPAEVDFLFAGPFHRRELLYYKLRQSIRNAIFAGTIFGLVAVRYTPSFLAAWLGCVLTILFINSFTLAGTLLGQRVSERANTTWRRIVLAGILLLIGMGLVQTLPHFDPRNVAASVELFRQSVAGRVLLAPFEVFPRIMTAMNLAELAMWSTIGAGMVAALFALSVSLDVNYFETAGQVSQRLYERLQRMRQGGGGAIGQVQIRGTRRIRIPPLPWLWGAGPNLWRQSLLMVRRAQGLVLLIMLIVLGGAAIVTVRRETAQQSVYLLPLMVVGGLAYQSLLAALQLPVAFRSDLDRMDWLKALPLRPAAIVWGEVCGPVLMLSLLQAGTLLGAWALFRQAHEVFAAGLAFIVPVNLLIFAVDNLVFLIFPVRRTPTTAGDFQFLGKFLLLAMLRMTLVCVGLAVAAAGAILYLLIPHLWLALSGSLVLLVAIDAMVVYAASIAFVRFDVSVDTPAA